MRALQTILDKPYGTRTPVEQCISDAVTLEDEHDGDYALMEQAAEEHKAMGELVRAAEEFVKYSMKIEPNPFGIRKKWAELFKELFLALRKVQKGSASKPSDVGK